MAALADLLAGLPFASALRRSATAYALVSAGHILSIGLILGAILPLDLRLIGVIRHAPLPAIAPFLSRVAAVGVALAILTGLALISVRPEEYLANPAIWAKMTLIALALLNVVFVHAMPDWRRVLMGDPPGTPLRIAASVSALCWIGALIAGRMIGFL